MNQFSKLNSISNEKSVSFKINLVAIAHNFCNASPEQNPRINLKEMKESLKSIKTIDKIFIIKPENYSGVVIFNKYNYITKMMAILSDKTIFKELK